MTNGVAESVAQQPDSAKRPFGMRDKIGYMFGDFGNDFTFILQMMFFMLFYTNVVGIQPGHVGLLFLVARLVDGFTDVGMGILVDRLPVKPGGDKFVLRKALSDQLLLDAGACRRADTEAPDHGVAYAAFLHVGQQCCALRLPKRLVVEFRGCLISQIDPFLQ